MRSDHDRKALSKKTQRPSENLSNTGDRACKYPGEKQLLNELMVDQLGDMAIWTWADGRIFFANEKACRSLGYARNELLSMKMSDIDVNYHPDKLSGLIEKNENLRNVLTESAFRAKDGRTFPVEVSANHGILDGKEYIVSLCRDTTRRKKAEEALRESEKKYRTLVEQVSDWVWEIDTNGLYTYASPRVHMILGYAPEEVIGTSPFDYMAPGESDRVRALFDPIFEARKDFNLLENTLVKKDGGTVTVETNGMPKFDARGAFAGYRGSDRDITERKRAEEALRKSEEKFRQIAENVNDIYFLVSADVSRLYYINPAFERITGMPVKEVYENPLAWLSLLPGEGRERALANIKKLTDGRVPDTGAMEHRFTRRDGMPGWVKFRLYAIRCQDGRLHRIVGVVEDITERKLAEEALRESESRLKHTERILYRSQEAGKVGSWHLDLRENDLWWSPETYRLFGLPDTTKLNYELFLSFVHEGDRAGVDRAWKAALAGAPYDIEHRILVDGRTKWVHEIAVLDFDEHGTPIFGIGTVTDITERKRAEEALKLANAYNRSLIEASVDPLVTIAPDGRITDVNKATEKVTGFSRERLIGTDFSDYFTEPEKAEDGYQKAFKEGSVTDYPLEIRHKNGHVTPVIYNASVYRDEAGAVIGVFAAARDITEQKKIEEARLRLAAIVDSSDDAIIGKTLDGVITSWNAGAASLYGYSEGEVIGKSIAILSSPDYPDEIPSILDKVRQGEHIDHYETVRRRKDGSNIYVSLSVSPIMDSAGRLVGASTITRDITEKKRAEEAIRTANAYNRGLIEASLDPLVTISPEGVITDVNKATEKVTGLSRERLIGTDFSDYFTEPGEAKKGYLTVFKEGFVTDYPLEIRHKDGHSTPVIYNASVYRDEAGKVIGVFAAARDITERRRAEEALKESEEKFKRIFDRTAIGIAMTDERGRLIDCNTAYQELLGYTKEELRGKHFIDLTYSEDRNRNMELQRQLAEGFIEKYSIEKRYIRKDGGLIWVRLTASAIRDRDGGLKNNLAVVEDVTESKQAEDALREAKDQVELYVDLMGHDINNMNQVSLGFLELAHNFIEMDGKLDENNIVLLDKAMDSLKNSSQLIGNVRKLQREKMGLYEPEVLDVGHVIDDAIEHLRSIPGRDISIARKPSGTYFVRANSLLKDVFVNLVGNAIKHSRGPLTVNIGMSSVVENGKTYCRVDVEDDGPGIPDALKSTLFDRLSLSTTRAKGKGFGLCLIKMLVDDYHGRFWVEDRVPGDYTKGTRFVVMLPAVM